MVPENVQWLLVAVGIVILAWFAFATEKEDADDEPALKRRRRRPAHLAWRPHHKRVRHVGHKHRIARTLPVGPRIRILKPPPADPTPIRPVPVLIAWSGSRTNVHIAINSGAAKPQQPSQQPAKGTTSSGEAPKEQGYG